MNQLAANLLLLAIKLRNERRESPPERGPSENLNLVDFLKRQGIYGYLQHHGVLDNSSSLDIREYYLRAAGFSFQCATTISQVVSALAKAGVRALAFKGVSWAYMAYDNIATRPFGDIDLIVPIKNRKLAHSILVDLGYANREERGSRGQQAALLHFSKAIGFAPPQAGQASIDLHTDLYSQWIALQTPFEELWERRSIVAIDQVKPFPTFGINDAVAFTCLHSYQDGWASLRGLLDLALLLNRYSPTWKALEHCSRPRDPLVARGITFAVHLLGAHAPRGWNPVFTTEETFERFADLFFLSEPPQLRLLIPSLWSDVSIPRLLKAVLIPSDEDIISVKLPPNLIQAYICIRALRLFRKLLIDQRALK